MKITIEGDLQVIELKDKDFIHAGGEGSVYVKGDIAYKIYHDPSKMIETGRLLEFQKIDLVNVIKPEKIIYDLSGKAIGYTMKALNDVWALTRLFNKSFRRKHNVSNDCILSLVSKMRETYARLHQLGFLVTDGNELNFLVSSDFSEIFFIDVDAFQTPSFPGRAYNESTLDPNMDMKAIQFSSESDWFAFAVVACQMLIGIHPFKGIYEGNQYKFAKNDIPARIKSRISIFNDDVKLARPIMTLKELPANYHGWFSQIFESDTRIDAPVEFGDILTESIIATVISKALKVSELNVFEDIIQTFYSNGRVHGYKTNKHFFFANEKMAYKDPDSEMIFLPRSNLPILVKEEKGNIIIYNTTDKNIYQQNCGLHDIYICDNRVYGITNSNLLEFSFRETSNGIKIMSEMVEEMLPGTVQFFDGLIAESLMGGLHVSLPIAEGSCAKIHIRELDGKRILNAKHHKGVLAFIWYNNGNYTRSIYKLDKQYRKYKLIEEEMVDDLEINLTVLEQGVAIFMSEPGVIKVFAANYNQDGIKEIRDASLDPNIRFVTAGLELHGILDKSIYKLAMS